MKKEEVVKLFTEAFEKGEDINAVHAKVVAAGVSKANADKWKEEAQKAISAKEEDKAEEGKFADKAAELFARYPHVNVLYFTDDVTGFFHDNDAKNHAKTLGNKTVTKVEK